MTVSRSFGKMAMSFLSVLLANSPVMVCKTSGSTVTFERNKLLTSSLVLVISIVEQFSTFGSCQTAGSPSHNLDASPKILTELNLALH